MRRLVVLVPNLLVAVGGVERGLGCAFTPLPTWERGRAGRSCGIARRTTQYVARENPLDSNERGGTMSGDPEHVYGLEEEAKVNPVARLVLAGACTWAMDGVRAYLEPENGSRRREMTGVENRHLATKVKALDDQRRRLANIVLCSATEEKKAAEMAKFMDYCETKYGTGTTMCLTLLDGLWSLPAPFRPDVGDAVIVEAYEALRRYGVLTKFGALKTPANRMHEPQDKREHDSRQTDRSSITSFVTWADRLWNAMFVSAVSILGFAAVGVDLKVTGECWWVVNAMLVDSVFLEKALFRELQHWIMPSIKVRAAQHEAGHFLLSYLLGCPVSVYTVGGWPSIVHGRRLGSNPFVGCIDLGLGAVLQGPQESSRALEGPRLRTWNELSGDEMVDVLWRFARDDWETEGGVLAVDSREVVMGNEAALDMQAHVETFGEAQRNEIANRFALLVMAGVAAENVVTGFDIGGRADRENLRMTLLQLWPVVSGLDMINTEAWATAETTRILTAERKALNLLTSSMLGTRQIGRLIVELERTLTASRFEASS